MSPDRVGSPAFSILHFCDHYIVAAIGTIDEGFVVCDLDGSSELVRIWHPYPENVRLRIVTDVLFVNLLRIMNVEVLDGEITVEPQIPTYEPFVVVGHV